MAVSVFEIHQLVDDDRPMTVLKRDSDLDEASLTNYEIIRGESGYRIETWTPWDDFFCEHRRMCRFENGITFNFHALRVSFRSEHSIS